jgi:membrane protein DedA with SNARE-associated domain
MMSADTANAILSVVYLALAFGVIHAALIESEILLIVCGVITAMTASLGFAIALNGHPYLAIGHAAIWVSHQVLFLIMTWWIERSRAETLEREKCGRYRGLRNV